MISYLLKVHALYLSLHIPVTVSVVDMLYCVLCYIYVRLMCDFLTSVMTVLHVRDTTFTCRLP